MERWEMHVWRIVIASHGHSNEASAKPLFRGRPVFWCSQMSHDIQRWSSKLWSFKGRTSCELLRPIGICRSRDSRRIVDCLLSEVWLPPSVRTRSSPFELSRFQDSGHVCPRRSSARRNAISRCSLVGDPAFAVAPKPLQCNPPRKFIPIAACASTAAGSTNCQALCFFHQRALGPQGPKLSGIQTQHLR